MKGIEIIDYQCKAWILQDVYHVTMSCPSPRLLIVIMYFIFLKDQGRRCL